MKTLKPIKDRVLVRMHERATESAGGIVLPEVSRTTETWGIVEAVGETVSEEIDLEDEVFIPSTAGTHFVVGGKDVVLVSERDILAKRTGGGETTDHV